MMKKILLLTAIAHLCFISNIFSQSANDLSKLKIVFIRHGEKPKNGDNLNCQGLNRSMLLPKLITTRFGIPDYTFIPAMGLDSNTKHSRMFQTLIPLAVKYNLHLNSKHQEKEYNEVAADIKSKTGLVLVCWEHKALVHIVEALGVKGDLKWADDDYESMWIIIFKNGEAVLTKEKEGLKPGTDCPF